VPLVLTGYPVTANFRAMKRWILILAALLPAIGCRWLETTLFPVQARDGRFEYDDEGNVVGKRPLPVRIDEPPRADSP
jgi:hypothetical protein